MKGHKPERSRDTAAAPWVVQRGPQAANALDALALRDAMQLLEVRSGPVVRSTPHRSTRRLESPGFEGYLKRYEAGAGRIGKISRRRSPAETEWRALARAREAGLPVPDAVAAIWSARGDRAPSALLLAAVPDGARLDDLLREGRLAEPARDVLLRERLVALVRGLHAAGLQHRDLYACHVLYEPGSGQLVLIDLARLRPLAPWARQRRVKDLAALAYSLDGIVRRAELLRLLCLYLGPSGSTPRLRSLLKAVHRKALRIARHEPLYG